MTNLESKRLAELAAELRDAGYIVHKIPEGHGHARKIVVYVTHGEVDAAKALIELSESLGKPISESWHEIANAITEYPFIHQSFDLEFRIGEP